MPILIFRQTANKHFFNRMLRFCIPFPKQSNLQSIKALKVRNGVEGWCYQMWQSHIHFGGSGLNTHFCTFSSSAERTIFTAKLRHRKCYSILDTVSLTSHFSAGKELGGGGGKSGRREGGKRDFQGGRNQEDTKPRPQPHTRRAWEKEGVGISE